MAWDWVFTVMKWSLLFSILQGVHYLTSDGALSRINQINESMIFTAAQTFPMTLMLLLHLISNHQHFMIEIYASLL
jgi:hypothetical protein